MSKEISDAFLQQIPIRRLKLYEMVAQKIEDMILSGELKCGDRLPSERDIMTAYNIGRPAVREAFLALQNKGLIITENGRRARVRIPSVDNVITTLDSVVGLMINDETNLKILFDARVFIESAMARHAAEKIDKDRLAALREILGANKKAIGNLHRFMDTDIVFHRILFQTADNTIFDAVHRALVNWIMDRWGKLDLNETTETTAYRGHLLIYKAISNGNPDAAEKAMRKHLASSWKTWASQLDSNVV